MRIAFLSIYSGNVKRGVESFVDEMARELVKKGHEVSVFQNGEKNGDETYDVKTVKVFNSWPKDMTESWQRRLFIDFYSLKILVFSLKAGHIIRRNKYDIIIPTNGFWQTLVMRILTRVFGSKLLITGHSGPGYDERWNLIFKPDVFVATTPSVYEWAKEKCFYTRIELIPYGINIDKYQKAKATSVDLEKPIILCSAAAVPYKRVDTAINAVAKLKKGSLLYLGGGDLKNELTEMGNKLLGTKRFLSLAVNNSEMPGYYQACDVVTLPSTSQENSPMTFLEAMAAGKFVVATDASRPRWMLRLAGIFVNPEDANEYAKAIETALKRKDTSVIWEQVAKFSWEKIIDEYEKLFKSITQ